MELYLLYRRRKNGRIKFTHSAKEEKIRIEREHIQLFIKSKVSPLNFKNKRALEVSFLFSNPIR